MAVEAAPSALLYASERLKNDKEVVLAAVKRSGAALEYASEELRDDREMVLSAVYSDWGCLKWVASQRLQQDEELLEFAKKCKELEIEYQHARTTAALNPS